MSVSLEVCRERTDDTVPAGHWEDERTTAVVLAREDGAVIGSVVVLDLGADDPALRFAAVPEGAFEALVPMLREAAALVGAAGGTALRWVAESDEMPPSVPEELGATEDGEVYRWWRLELSAAARTVEGGGAGPVEERPAGEDAVFRLGLADALFDVEIEEDTAVLVHDREEEHTPDELTALVGAVVRRVREAHPAVRAAEAYAAPDDDTLGAALTAVGFVPTDRRAVEYLLPLGG
ncbi:hypothetical protein J7W19_31010 [Streptomyces mobaraensis NBRC 13819 = DSM 40847]|uniref:GNAT family N-acetyltransferase n=2 Tax=Streptomyces mobaraensis TaxID=35621 RepID=A0A5N5W9C0_STRMB|nr:hypothetical protein [Streptomyces mobaraensis]EMF01309.1 hypothetical protein H340_06891 [Streptomyces mobaraensis NBRC 13819 = DSM 40847]KAB7845026.1 hypothetical protein FRZ00_15055 [Streptomyces mobaraensis]QTT77226.1 hypothetical protein J7W19_31010 [Streptomyces mobaraensis NBRC 13819 = DSM 40847]